MDDPPPPMLDDRPSQHIDLDVPLFVDLDGTVLATDLLWESLLELVRESPQQAWRIPLWLLRGRATLKQELAVRVRIEAATLPYRAEVLDYLARQHAEGRTIVLATATHEDLAREVAAHLGLFDAVLASNATTNLKGRHKLAAIREHCGAGVPFDYMGDAHADLPIWSETRRPVVIGPGKRLLSRVRGLGVEAEVISTPGKAASQVVRAMRPHQWAKNALIFVPLIMAHMLTDWRTLGRAAVAFACFCMAASSCYILNDMLDLKADRRHHSKKKRPLASGRLSIPASVVLCTTLLIAALSLAATLGLPFLGMVLLYAFLTTAYSVSLKRKLMVDVLCLASLYTHRILSGGVAANIVISPWMLAFSMFLFLSLAFVKRYSELAIAPDTPGKISGRGYRPSDLDMVRSVGPASGYMCVVIFCLYINSSEVIKHYHHPDWLWMACPVLLYWISRIWFLAQRGELHHDPVVFALRDRISYYSGILVAVILFLAR